MPFRALVTLLVVVALALAGLLALTYRETVDWPAFVLATAVLVVTSATLFMTIAGPAKLIVVTQPELGYDDLIFYVLDAPLALPRDILLQMHVAVANVGGRKGVLSRLDLIEFQDKHGKIAKPLWFPFPMRADIYRTTRIRGFEGGLPADSFRVETSGPPVILEPDDVITLRFRARRGTDWKPEPWTLDRLKELGESITTPIERAKVRVTYRRGRDVVTHEDFLPVKTLQQDKYLAALKAATKDYTVRPDVPVQPFELE